MAAQTIDQQLQDIQQKLEVISGQLQEYQRRQRELDELKKDLTLISKDIFEAAVDELEDVAPYFDSSDLIFLFKKLLRNTRNLNKMLSQLESIFDLVDDLKPLGKQVFDEVLNKMNYLDQKGYFEFSRELVKIIDTIVTSFPPEDLRLLRQNITSILLTVKDLTQPDILHSINNAVSFFRKMDIEVDQDISYFSLLKEFKNPDVKRGLVFMLEFVKNMAQSKNTVQPINSTYTISEGGKSDAN